MLDVEPPLDSYPPAPDAPKLSIRSDLQGIGGWLILVAIGLIVAPLLVVRGIYIDLRLLHSSRFPQILSDHPSAANILVAEICVDAFFFVALIALNYFFYCKKKVFRDLICVYWLLQTVFAIMQGIAIDILFSRRGLIIGSQAGTVVAALIWLNYFNRSERVKATFVN